MATEFSLIPENQTFFTAAGDLASGYQLFIYEAGSSTKATTHTESDGLTANTNPIVLDALGQTPYGVYVATGTYKTVLASDTDTDPPATPIRTRDNITARNDALAAAQSEWVSGPTPTYVGGTSFTLVGDQTSDFHIGRRLKLTDSGGISYATISNSAYTSLTTITVVNDSSVIDSGLSAVDYALSSAANLSTPYWDSNTEGKHKGSDGTKPVWLSGGGELVESATLSGASGFELSGAGIDGTAVDFPDGYRYCVVYDVYGDTNDEYMVFNLYESAAIRNGSNSYLVSFNGTSGASAAQGSSTPTVGYFSTSGWGTANWKSAKGFIVFENLGSTTYASEAWGRCRAVNNTPTLQSYSHDTSVWHSSGTDMFRACNKIAVVTNGGNTMTGRILFFRQRIT